MSEMEQKTTQEMANSAAECIFAENMAEALTDDALDNVSGGYPRPPQAGPLGGPIYDGKGRICGYDRSGVIYYYKCPDCGRPMHYFIGGYECALCGISRGGVNTVRWTKGKQSLIAASTAL